MVTVGQITMRDTVEIFNKLNVFQGAAGRIEPGL